MVTITEKMGGFFYKYEVKSKPVNEEHISHFLQDKFTNFDRDIM